MRANNDEKEEGALTAADGSSQSASESEDVSNRK